MSRVIFAFAVTSVLALFQAPPASAGAPNCYPYNGSGYCQYDGRVREAYINSSNQIILYFDTPVNPASAAAVGLAGVTVDSAAIYLMQNNPDFGKALFAAMLAAQSRGAMVSVQMHSVYGGFLVMDRIWVRE
jgi:hypothetical protein